MFRVALLSILSFAVPLPLLAAEPTVVRLWPGKAPGETAAVADEERAQPRVDGRRVVELEARAHAAPVQVPDARDEVGDPAHLRLEVVVGVGDHRGVEPEAGDDEEDVLLVGVRAGSGAVPGSSPSAGVTSA